MPPYPDSTGKEDLKQGIELGWPICDQRMMGSWEILLLNSVIALAHSAYYLESAATDPQRTTAGYTRQVRKYFIFSRGNFIYSSHIHK